MVRICHVTSVHKVLDARIFRKECSSLAKAGYDVWLVATNADTQDINGVHIVGVNNIITNRLFRIFFTSRKVYEVADSINAEIYHIHDPELLPFVGKFKKKGKKVIFDSHEDIPTDVSNKPYIPFFFRGFIKRMYSIYEKKVLSMCDGLISTSPEITSRLEQINKNTVQVTNYPISTDVYDIPDEKYENPSLFFAGGVNDLWCHEAVVQALDYVPENVRYLIAGAANSEYIEKLTNMKSGYKVKYLGFLSFDQIIRIYKKSIIGIAIQNQESLTYKRGTLGNTKTFEVMQAGIPVICANLYYCKLTVEKAGAGIIVDSNNPFQIADAINKLLNNPELASQMGEKGKQAIKILYNWESQEKILLNFYLSIT